MTRRSAHFYRTGLGLILVSALLAWLALWGIGEDASDFEASPWEPSVQISRSSTPLKVRPRPQEPSAVESSEVGQVRRTTPSVAAPDRAVIEARVGPSGWVRVLDCKVLSRTRRGGAFHLIVAPGPCELRGERRDGMLTVFGTARTLRPRAGDRLEVSLPMPEGRVGGIGVRFEPESEGMRVLHLVEGSPAWSAGLEPGDLIVEVDGAPTADMESVEFIQRMTGEESTDVSFVIGWDGDTGWTEESLDVARQYLSG